MIDSVSQSQLVAFLNQGKGLYIEGSDFGYSNSTTQLYQMFGCAYVGNGNPYTTGNVNTLAGQVSTIVEGKDYLYLYQNWPDQYVDLIDATDGTLLYLSQDGNGRAVEYEGPGNSYRAVHSTFTFGGLRDGSSTKKELMALYLNYLLGN